MNLETYDSWANFENRRGYSPAFLKRVRAKRRRKAQEEKERKAAERAAALAALKEALKQKAKAKPKPVAKPVPKLEPIVIHPNVTVKAIITRVAELHGLTYADIIGKSRAKHIVKARQDAIVTVRLERPDVSLAYIGKQFCRDHTTIIHALQVRGVHTSRAKAAA